MEMGKSVTTKPHVMVDYFGGKRRMDLAVFSKRMQHFQSKKKHFQTEIIIYLCHIEFISVTSKAPLTATMYAKR